MLTLLPTFPLPCSGPISPEGAEAREDRTASLDSIWGAAWK